MPGADLWTFAGLKRRRGRDEPSGEGFPLLTALSSAVLRVIFLPTIGDETRGTGLAVLSAAFPFPASAVADLLVPGLFPLAIAKAGGRYCDTVRDG